MRLLAASLLMIVAADRAPTAALDDKYLETIKVSETVYVFKPKIDWTHGNGVAIIGPDGVFFIDTFIQFNYAEEAIRRLQRITKLPVRYVLNTHSHNDHVMGNAVFRRVFPGSRIVTHSAALAGLEGRVKGLVQDQAGFIKRNLAEVDSEVRTGRTTGGTPLTGSMKAYWDLSLREAREYQEQFRPEQYVSPDITFGDTLTMRWGDQTLRMIHMTEYAHSRSDVVVWIPETRILVTGDIVVAPTPYYNLPGIKQAVHDLIAMNPAIVIPGHGTVQYDLTYMQLLERAFTEYMRAAEAARAANVPVQDALKTIAFPDIDRAFTGDDDMKKYAYRAFFTNNVIVRTYEPLPTPAPAPVPGP